MTPTWRVVGAQELRDSWRGGRALPLLLGYSLLLSATTYLAAVNQDLNFLEQRESAGLALQVAVALGALLALLGAADSVSGERERHTLEALLLSPAPRLSIVTGKAIAALSLWLGAYVLSLPYVWYLGHDVGVTWRSAAAGLVVGSLLALLLVGLGTAISAVSSSNRVSLSVSLFLLLALFAPSQLPSAAQQGWAGDLVIHVDPFSSGLRFLSRLVVDGHSVGDEVGWLVSPAIGAVLAVLAAVAAGRRLRLGTGGNA